MVEIRRLETDDLPQLQRMHVIVFNFRRDFSKEEENEPDPLDHPAHWAWGAFEGKKLLAGIWEIEFLMRFDGHDVKMSGIGGVGTLPEARKGGYVRRIFEKMLPEAYEKGVLFSSLAPFSHDFYRKFGYEICCARNNISIPANCLSIIKPYGQFILVHPGDDTSLLAEVHSEYIKNINHGVNRDYWSDNRAWKNFTRQDPYASGSFIYLWKDETGKPKSYIKYQDKTEEGEHQMSISEFAFSDIKGMYGAFGLVSGLSAQFENLKWAMPVFIDPFDFIGDAWSVEQKIKPKDMTRIINIKTALELMRSPPDCEGQYIIEVNDENITANSGKYLVQFGSRGSKVSSTSKNADIQCDIPALSQLVTGYRSLENALYSRQKGLTVNGNLEILKRVFTERPQHLTEYF
ncbi:MAG: GNAT family N-acetyltransferase [Treponema sp.]|nr:GNAT family N-acetyltransferase [Treponema sp.]MCL2272247.1 GNAT family N-acetyltransferase [Treponema sp.]